MKHDPLDAAGSALCWWDVSFQFAYYNSAEKQKQRSSCFLDNIRRAFLFDILASDQFVYRRSWPTADIRMHLSSTRHSNELVYKKNWPTTDVRIRHQRSIPTRWGLLIGTDGPRSDKHNDKSSMITTPKTSFLITQGLDNSRACGQSEGATIQADVFDTSKHSWYDQRSWPRLDNLMMQ